MLNLKARETLTSYWAPGKVPLHGEHLQISEHHLDGIIRVQGVAESAAFREAVAKAIGIQPPAVGQYVRTNQYEFAWVGPREWILFVPLAKEYEYLAALNEAFAGTFATAALMSDSRFALEISGSSALAFLSKGTGLNTDPAEFPPSSATTTRFMGMPALLVHRESGSYRLYFDVSYAAYVSAWVLDASEEFLTQSA